MASAHRLPLVGATIGTIDTARAHPRRPFGNSLKISFNAVTQHDGRARRGRQAPCRPKSRSAARAAAAGNRVVAFRLRKTLRQKRRAASRPSSLSVLLAPVADEFRHPDGVRQP